MDDTAGISVRESLEMRRHEALRKAHHAPTSAPADIYPGKLRLPGTPVDMVPPLPFLTLVLLVAGMIAGLFCTPAARAQAARFHLEAKWVIGGLGQWRAMAQDPVSHLLYVTRQDHVIVVNPDTGRQVSDIGGFQNAFGIAFDRSGRGYIAAGGGSVVIFERKDNRVIRAVPAGLIPESIVFEPATNTVWAMDVRGNQAIVVDTTKGGTTGAIPLGGRPVDAVADGQGSVYAALLQSNHGKAGATEIVKVGAKLRKVVARWPVPGCETPSSLAADPADKRLFVVCHGGELVVLDTASGKVKERLTVGKDAGDAAYLPAAHDLVVADGSGVLKVIAKQSSGEYTIVESVPTLPGARIMTPGVNGRRVYLAAADSGIPLQIARQITHPRPIATPGPFVILVITK